MEGWEIPDKGRLCSRPVRVALKAAGLAADDYAGHSFRIGAATTAAQCGLQDALI